MERKISNIKERLLHFTDIQGIAKELFFKNIGMTYGSFKGVQKKSALNSDAIERILSNHPELNPDWLLTGKGEMLRSKVSSQELSPGMREFYEDQLDQKDIALKEAHKEHGRLEGRIEQLEKLLELKDKEIERLKSSGDVVAKKELKS